MKHLQCDLFLLFMFFSFSLLGQNLSLSGKVTDTLNNPLPFTNILAKPINPKLK